MLWKDDSVMNMLTAQERRTSISFFRPCPPHPKRILRNATDAKATLGPTEVLAD
jgi:hypothetical protein